jgi:hypothetical protein
MRSLGIGLVSLALALAPARRREASDAPAASYLVTLYAHDDLQSSFDFRRGHAGGHVERGEVRLTAQIAFDVLAPDRISFGLVRDERVEVLDLGGFYVPSQPRARDRSAEFPISLFHTLFFDGVRFGYFGPGGDRHSLDEADRILGSLPPETIRHIDPVVGHTYVVRVHPEGVGAGDELFKFQVVDLVPEQSLTIRWAALGAR